MNRVPRGVSQGGQFAASARADADVFLDPYDDEEEEPEFEFDWNRMSFDDYNGWTAWDPDEPRHTWVDAERVQIGDAIHDPSTASVYRTVARVEASRGVVNIWAEEQGPDEPALVSVREGQTVLAGPARPVPNLDDPEQFRRELARRVYERVSWEVSSADEPHDVERLAYQAVDTIRDEMLGERSSGDPDTCVT